VCSSDLIKLPVDSTSPLLTVAKYA
jgi:hypothetical protein